MKHQKTRNIRIWFGVALAVTVLLRLVMFVTYPAISYSDTSGYRRSADAVLGGFQSYDGTRTLQVISVQLVLTHPFQFISNVLRGWWMFWRAPVYWDASVISPTVFATVLRGFVQGACRVLFLVNMVFILTTAGACLSSRLRQLWNLRPFLWLLAGSVWATSVFSSILDHGDNPRFLVPMQTAVVFWVLWLVMTEWPRRRAAGAELQ